MINKDRDKKHEKFVPKRSREYQSKRTACDAFANSEFSKYFCLIDLERIFSFVVSLPNRKYGKAVLRSKFVNELVSLEELPLGPFICRIHMLIGVHQWLFSGNNVNGAYTNINGKGNKRNFVYIG